MNCKTRLPILAMTIMALLFAFSCNKQEETPPQQSTTDLLEKIRAAAEEEWNASHSGQSNSDRVTDRDAPTKAACNCTYTITDMKFTLANGTSNAMMELYSSEECNPGSPTGCNYFSGVAYTGPDCAVCNNAGCCDEWTSIPPPSTANPFNCSVPAYSNFPVIGNGIWYANACNNGGSLKNWRVTYKVTCQSTKGEGCGGTTPPITYAASYPILSRTGTIKLDGECGCLPQITEQPVCDEAQCGGYYSGQYSTGNSYHIYPAETLYLCPGGVSITGIPYGVPNRYTVRKDGAIIDSKWVGDWQTYPNPYYGQNLPTTYNFSFTAVAGSVYTLQVETITPQNMTDAWDATIYC